MAAAEATAEPRQAGLAAATAAPCLAARAEAMEQKHQEAAEVAAVGATAASRQVALVEAMAAPCQAAPAAGTA